MRLYLSSYDLGNHPEELQKLAGEHARVAVISNAGDFTPDEERVERTQQVHEQLRRLGFEPSELDLRKYFEKKFSNDDLKDFDLVWVRGGNVFNLRKAMAESGFDEVITRALRADVIAYGGYSAGACVLAPTLYGIELCDPLGDVPEGYPAETDWSGLNLIPYSIAPHYKSDHPETTMIDDVVSYFDTNHMSYKTLRDGEVIVIDGDKEVLLT